MIIDTIKNDRKKSALKAGADLGFSRRGGGGFSKNFRKF